MPLYSPHQTALVLHLLKKSCHLHSPWRSKGWSKGLSPGSLRPSTPHVAARYWRWRGNGLSGGSSLLCRTVALASASFSTLLYPSNLLMAGRLDTD